jgi:hypothetical protein
MKKSPKIGKNGAKQNVTLGNFCYFMKKTRFFSKVSSFFIGLHHKQQVEKDGVTSILGKTLLRSMAQSLSRSMVSLGTKLMPLDFN